MLDLVTRAAMDAPLAFLLIWLYAASALYALAVVTIAAGAIVAAAGAGWLVARGRPAGLRPAGISLLLLIAVGVAWLFLPQGGSGRLLLTVVMALAVVSLLAALAGALPDLARLPTRTEFHRVSEALSDATVAGRIAQAELARSEGRFQSAFECSAVAMVITDAYGRLRRHNAASARLFGWGGRSASHVAAAVHPDDRERLQRAVARAVRNGSARVELRLHAGDNRTIWVVASLAPMATAGEGRMEFVWQLQDVTERKAYEHSLREERDRAGRLVTARTEELARTNKRLAQANARLMRMAGRDQLTGIGNRRHLDQALGRAVESARRYGHALSVIMIDVDHFKRINDRHGHQTGDRVLAAVARVVATSCRRTDVLARYGGDELCLVLPHTDATRMHATAEKIHRRVGDLAVAGDRGSPVTLTCSVGGAEWTPDLADAEALLRRADQALYSAKRQGRDRVVTAEPNARPVVHTLNTDANTAAQGSA